jgi:hypothetical protein
VIWVILVALGVPLWLCAAGILTLVLRNRAIRHRPGNIPCRLRTDPNKRWRRGHGVWIHDVFGFRGSPAAWVEALWWVTEVSVRPATAEDGKFRGIGDHPVIATMETSVQGRVEVAARAEVASALTEPFGERQRQG